ncbi:hypothetical protein D9M73_153340 [compost metagenome]
MRLCFCPCAMSTLRISRAPAFFSAAWNAGTLPALETSELNHNTRSGTCALCAAMRLRNAASPPSHQSSLLCPPKFSTGSLRDGSCLPRFFHLRRLPLWASSAEEWKGGLHMLSSKRSPSSSRPRKICCGSGWRRRSMASPSRLSWTMARAEASAVASMSAPRNFQP